jgi:hypothetical protein
MDDGSTVITAPGPAPTEAPLGRVDVDCFAERCGLPAPAVAAGEGLGSCPLSSADAALADHDEAESDVDSSLSLDSPVSPSLSYTGSTTPLASDVAGLDDVGDGDGAEPSVADFGCDAGRCRPSHGDDLAALPLSLAFTARTAAASQTCRNPRYRPA